MKKIVFLLIWGSLALNVFAQQKAPKWMEKQKKAVVSITTYKADGTTLHNGTGFFITEDGLLLSAYSLFKGADKATVTDTNGKTYPVSRVLGADELYDVIKLQVEIPKKVSCLEMAEAPLQVNAPAYLLPFVKEKGKVKSFGNGKVEEVTKLKETYHYYKLSFPLQVGWTNAPVCNEEGQVFGLAQEDASGKNACSYAVSAAYANSLAITSTDAFNSTYSTIGIRKAWPADREQAKIATYIIENTQDAKSFLETLNDFVATFPDWWESYSRRASHYVFRRSALASDASGQAGCLAKAEADLKQSIELSDNKSEALYNAAQLIYSAAVSDTTLKNNPNWNLERAQAVLTEALQAQDIPAYHQLQADIYFAQGQYEQAYQEYMTVNQSDAANANSWYMASKAKSAVIGFNIGDIIQLLDSAVACCGNPPSVEAAPYVLERIDWKLRLMRYKEAVADYDLYYQIYNGKVDDNFYYYREQAKFRMDDLDGALQDIQQAMNIAPQNAMYPAEEASIYIRQKKYEEALRSIDKALAIAPEFAACYRLRGICLQRSGKAEEARAALLKAKELGDPAAEKLLGN